MDIPQLLTQALYRENQTKAWCETCRKYQPTIQIKPLHSLPRAFAINCALPSAATVVPGDDDPKKAGTSTSGAGAQSTASSLPTRSDTRGERLHGKGVQPTECGLVGWRLGGALASLSVRRDGQRWAVRGLYSGARSAVSSLSAKFAAMTSSDGGAATTPADNDPLLNEESVWADSALLDDIGQGEGADGSGNSTSGGSGNVPTTSASSDPGTGGTSGTSGTTGAGGAGGAGGGFGADPEAEDDGTVIYDLIVRSCGVACVLRGQAKRLMVFGSVCCPPRQSFVVQIQQERERPHLVAHVLGSSACPHAQSRWPASHFETREANVRAVPEAYHARNAAPEGPTAAWYLFNDFLVSPIALSKAVQLAPWKVRLGICLALPPSPLPLP